MTSAILWMQRRLTTASPAGAERFAAEHGIELCRNEDLVIPREVERLHARGYRVMLYTVNEVETAEALLDAGVDGLFTDNLAEFAARFASLI